MIIMDSQLKLKKCIVSDKIRTKISTFPYEQFKDVPPIMALSAAIVFQAAWDYRMARLYEDDQTLKECESFFFSRWFGQLTEADANDFMEMLDNESLEKIIKMREKNMRSRPVRLISLRGEKEIQDYIKESDNIDEKTLEWLKHNLCKELTLIKCAKCKKEYKAVLGHNCREKYKEIDLTNKCGSCKYAKPCKFSQNGEMSYVECQNSERLATRELANKKRQRTAKKCRYYQLKPKGEIAE